MKLKLLQEMATIKTPPITCIYSHGIWEARDESGNIIGRGETEREARDRARTYYALVAFRGRTPR